MFFLTPTERKVLVSAGILILVGSAVKFSKDTFISNKIYSSEDKNISAPAAVCSAVVDINKAGLDELMKLPGIGEKTANQIIEYRSRQGGFSSLDDLKQVKGIGDKKLAAIRKYITLTVNSSQGHLTLNTNYP